MRLKLPDGTLIERELVAGTKTGARKIRDDVFAAYNELALSILAGEDQRATKPRPAGIANRRRDRWWPARGRSVGGNLLGSARTAMSSNSGSRVVCQFEYTLAEG